jgi:hypothetical protein
MPALPPVPSVLRIEVDFEVGTDASALTRWYMLYSGTAPAAADVAAFAGSLISFAGTELASLMHSDTSITEARVTDIASDVGEEGIGTGITAGTRSGDQLPASAAVLFNSVVGRRWRGGKPRGYWPLGTATDLETRQTWLGDSQSAFLSGISNVVNHLTGETSGATTVLGRVNVSYYGPPNRIITGSTGRVRTVSTVRTAPQVDLITGSSVNLHVASQRRRDQIRV